MNPVAWWNKSVGGFYLNESHIKEYEKVRHNIVELYESPNTLEVHDIRNEALNTLLKDVKELLEWYADCYHPSIMSEYNHKVTKRIDDIMKEGKI